MEERVSLANIRRLHGEVVEEATMARDLLAPAAGRLSGDPSGLYDRCVLARSAGFFRHPDDVRRDLARFGPIEAVAVCGVLHEQQFETLAVVVFVTAERAAVALDRLGLENLPLSGQKPPAVVYGPVPPLYVSFPSCLIQPELVLVAFYPPPPALPRPQGALATASGEARGETNQNQTMVEPRTTGASTSGVEAAVPDDMKEFIVPIATQFMPSMNSRVYGPRVGPDGLLWIHGNKFTHYKRGLQIDDLLVRVTQVAPNYYILQPHMYFNLVLL